MFFAYSKSQKYYVFFGGKKEALKIMIKGKLRKIIIIVLINGKYKLTCRINYSSIIRMIVAKKKSGDSSKKN